MKHYNPLKDFLNEHVNITILYIFQFQNRTRKPVLLPPDDIGLVQDPEVFQQLQNFIVKKYKRKISKVRKYAHTDKILTHKSNLGWQFEFLASGSLKNVSGSRT